jgi:hypothetical protein
VTNRVWALQYDAAKGRVVANREIQHGPPLQGMPIPSFGEDEKGEVYVLQHVANGRAIYRFAKAALSE